MKIEPRGDSPLHCIEHAISLYGAADPAFDEVWCVFDVDQFDMGEAGRRARKAGVELAVSNPCFELWLLLHMVDATRPFTDCRDVRRALTKELPGFSKSRLDFDRFRPGIDKAVDRARRLEEGLDRGALANPSTGVWRLAALIVGEGSDSTSSG